MNNTNSELPAEPVSAARRLNRAAPYVVLGIMFMLTLVVSYGAALFTQLKERARFDYTVEQERDKVQRLMTSYTVLLHGLRGLVDARLSMTQEQFYQYVENLNIVQNYPGIRGLGFALLVNKAEVEGLVDEVRKTGNETFRIWPAPKHEKLCVVRYLAPHSQRNDAWLGFDLLQDPGRNAAIHRAIETGTVASTTLVSEAAGEEAPAEIFALFAPAYSHGVPLNTKEIRLNNAMGIIICRIRFSEFFDAVTGFTEEDEGVRVRVHDGAKLASARLLYDSGPRGTEDDGFVPQFISTSGLQMADRTLSITFSTHAEFTRGVVSYLAPITFASGVAISLLLFGITMTQVRARTAAEKHSEELRIREEEFSASFYSTAVGQVQTVPETGRYLRVNRMFCQIVGYTEDELRQMTFMELTHPDDHVADSLAHQRLLRGELDVIHLEKRYVQKSGTVVWVNVSTSMVRDGAGKPLRRLAVIQDITARKAAEQALRMAESRFRRLVEQSLVGIYVYQNGRFPYVNPKMAEIYGYTVEEMLSVYFLDIVHDDDKPLVTGNIDNRFKGAAESVCYTLRGKRKDGSLIDVEVNGGISEFNGEPAILGVLLDVTERKRAEQEVKKLNMELEQRVRDRTAELEAANREMEAFSYSVSHDLRAPLRHIQGYAEILTNVTAGTLNEKAERYLKTISDAGIEMGKLIDALLTFARMSKVEMRQVPVPLDGLVQEALGKLKQVTEGREIEWIISPLPEVLGDPALLRQVFTNLLDNAVKYTTGKNPARIEIATDGYDGDRIIILIRDNGAGFDMKYAHKLFAVFQRLHRAEDFDGTGIGLANVRRIIERHGGRVWAEGKVNEGASIRFTLRPAGD